MVGFRLPAVSGTGVNILFIEAIFFSASRPLFCVPTKSHLTTRPNISIKKQKIYFINLKIIITKKKL